MPCTLDALRATTPKNAKIQLSPGADDHEKPGQNDEAEAAARTPAQDESHGQGERRRDRVAHGVGEERTGERGDPSDRQRLESIEHALVHVFAQLNAGDHGTGDDRLDEDPGDDQRQVVRDASGDRPAEQVREHQREDDGLDRDVDELLGSAADLEQPAIGHRERVADGLRDADVVLEWATGRAGETRSRAGGAEGGHAFTASFGEVLAAAAPSAGAASASTPCPVRVRNTSSSVGF